MGHLKGYLFAVGDGRKRGADPVPWQERFWRYITPGDPDACWEWTGSRDHRGYGRINIGGGHITRAHRASYELHSGQPIPAGLVVRHRCDNPPCVNPAHLLLGTMRDNSRDMAERGRSAAQRGYDNGRTTITDAQVIELRELAAMGTLHEDLAERFGMSASSVSEIARGNRRAKAGGPLSRRERDGTITRLG